MAYKCICGKLVACKAQLNFCSCGRGLEAIEELHKQNAETKNTSEVINKSKDKRKTKEVSRQGYAIR